jgi:antitoxin VapB
VRLPKSFRFQGNEVRIRRQGSAVILEPVAEDWSWLDAIVGRLDDDFVRAVNEQPRPQERPALDKFFR